MLKFILLGILVQQTITFIVTLINEDKGLFIGNGIYIIIINYIIAPIKNTFFKNTTQKEIKKAIKLFKKENISISEFQYKYHTKFCNYTLNNFYKEIN